MRISFADGSHGYADCHPWIEYGDLPLHEQLISLKNDHLTPLLKRSVYYAGIEAKARKTGTSVFENLALPKSHLQVKLGDDSSYPLQKVKLKADQVETFLNWANPSILWRLDFNCSFTASECEEFLEKACHLQLDFIEDPFPYNSSDWVRLQLQFGVDFAEDFEEGVEAQVAVCKPAVRMIPKSDKRRIVTSYLDHPIGQLSALYTAATDAQLNKEAGGFLSHTLYESNAFSDRLKIEYEKLIPPSGIGWGFDRELEELEWK